MHIWDLPNNNNNYSKSKSKTKKMAMKQTMETDDKRVRAGECGFCMARRSYFPVGYTTSDLSFGQSENEKKFRFCNEKCMFAHGRQEQRIDLEQDIARESSVSPVDYLKALELMKVEEPGSKAFDFAEFTANTYMVGRMIKAFSKALLSRNETIAQLHARRIKLMEKYGDLLTCAMADDDMPSELVGLIATSCSKFGNEKMGEIPTWGN